MAADRIGVIGAGISGPILATLFRLKGYEAVVCERSDAPRAGCSLTSHSTGAHFILIFYKSTGFASWTRSPVCSTTVQSLSRFFLDEVHFYSIIPLAEYARHSQERAAEEDRRVVRRKVLRRIQMEPQARAARTKR
ncbi:hypothetical protein PHLGIDRAFT_356527 [Phlebiopsis gigantea 11061_1 CR5-6]|uniref:Uncharacterized protein n=1 Tax=Phlebiopsis gigantea (strain 11061_1 CR5-6) TaxID=745531 RepID=A0A0C3RPI4_PHLG1|nr:hypothetical protein PHLGIDRAFT_356527 [Phlebiopsis gigantea 11061_1 CR5-6]